MSILKTIKERTDKSHMPDTLFRKEAVDAKRQTWLGRVQVLQPIPVVVVAYVSILICVLTFFYIKYGIYTRRVHASGYMSPPTGLITINVNATGVISNQNIYEGKRVSKGDVVVVVDSEATSTDGPTQKNVLAQLRRQSGLLREQKSIRLRDAPVEKKNLVSQLRYLLQQHDEIQNQISNDDRVMPVVEAALLRMQAAKKDHLVTEMQFQNQLYTYSQLQSSHAQSIQNLTDVESRIADNTNKIARFDGQLLRDVDDLDKNISQIEEKLLQSEANRTSVITASDDGVITAVRTNKGQHVQTGQAVATLLPTGHKLEASLFVSSASLGFLKEGQTVLLRYDAYPYQRFGLYVGRVIEITKAPVTITDNNQTGGGIIISNSNAARRDNTQQQDIYRVRVIPCKQFVEAYGEQLPLQAGMTVAADIAIDTRNIYQWIFDPVISLKEDIYMISGGMKN